MKYNLSEPEHEPCSITRYSVLRSIMSCYKLLAWVFILGAIVVSLFTGYIFDLKQAIPVILLALFSGVAGFINFMAISEAILVLLDIEQNTRLVSKCYSK